MDPLILHLDQRCQAFDMLRGMPVLLPCHRRADGDERWPYSQLVSPWARARQLMSPDAGPRPATSRNPTTRPGRTHLGQHPGGAAPRPLPTPETERVRIWWLRPVPGMRKPPPDPAVLAGGRGFPLGGARGIRTPDLLIANETRYQLRHSPMSLGDHVRLASPPGCCRIEDGVLTKVTERMLSAPSEAPAARPGACRAPRAAPGRCTPCRRAGGGQGAPGPPPPARCAATRRPGGGCGSPRRRPRS
jgi:hypothetical protein